VLISRETAEQVVKQHLMTAIEHNTGFWVLHVQRRKYRLPPISLMASVDSGSLMINPEIELLYGLRGDYWGKGLATEAGAAALAHLWSSTEFEKVYARADPRAHALRHGRHNVTRRHQLAIVRQR
jgi:RimJ/RimL family protein N-acetyltransferase